MNRIYKFLIVIIIFSSLFTLFIGRVKADESLRIYLNDDTYTEEFAPNILTWNQPNLYLGYDLLYGKGRTRIYQYLPLDSLVERGIHSNDIKSARLFIWQYYNQAGQEYLVDWGKNNSGWNQYELNWLNQPAFNKNGTMPFSKENGWQIINLHNMISIWYSTGFTRIPFVLKATEEYRAGGVFWSSECYEMFNYPRCESWQRPYLEVILKENSAPTIPVIQDKEIYQVQNSAFFEFNWQESTDPDNDPIIYGIQIGNNQNYLTENEIILGESVQSYSIELEQNGIFYYRVFAQDVRDSGSKRSYSNTYIIEFDNTPPKIPILEVEPPFSMSDKNTLAWDFEINSEPKGVDFKIERFVKEFDELVLLDSFDTENLGYEFTDLEEKTYCYRVNAKDFLNNISGWSELTCTKHDFTTPKIEKVNLDLQYISPINKDSIQDIAKFSVELSEENLNKWKLFVEDHNRNVVFSKEGNDVDFEIEFPNIELELIEGTYFIYIVAQDKVGLQAVSEPKILIVDNTPPIKANILVPEENSKINHLSPTLTFYTANNTVSKVDINGTVRLNIEGTTFSQKLNSDILKQGENFIKLESIDRAGNSSFVERKFYIDSIAPAIPQLNIIQKDNGGLDLNIQSQDFVKARIYTKAGFIKEVNSTVTEVVEKVSADSDYYFAVELIDDFGNKSNISEFVHLKTPKAEVLGVGIAFEKEYKHNKLTESSDCTYIYNETFRKVRKSNCDLKALSLERIENLTADKSTYNLVAYGGYNPKLNLHIQSVKCKEKSFWDPRTWFDCFEINTKGFVTQLDISGDFWLDINGKLIRHARRKVINDTSFVSSHLANQDYSYFGGSLFSDLYFTYQIENGVWIDFFDKSKKSDSVLIAKSIHNQFLSTEKKYFRFPFNRIIGVTQWHGYTAFASPHPGIDFGAYKEPIYAMADGNVAAVGWDEYYGKCYSGGNYIKITHDNGMNTFFAHLENYNRADGRAWQIGERVKKGELIGLTGNSGAFACEPLGYHLHFELRSGLWQGSHVNPVDYVEVDWMQVDTLGEEYVPGRLSGNNPHPTY